MLNNGVMTDKEIFVSMLERDVVSIYNSLANGNALLQMQPVKEKIYGYADYGIAYLSDLLFGEDSAPLDVDEASQVAEFVAKDKIKEYREKVKEARLNPK
jgi:hypothetical protein